MGLELVLDWNQASPQNSFAEEFSSFVVDDPTECFLVVNNLNYESFFAEQSLRLLADPLCV